MRAKSDFINQDNFSSFDDIYFKIIYEKKDNRMFKKILITALLMSSTSLHAMDDYYAAAPESKNHNSAQIVLNHNVPNNNKIDLKEFFPQIEYIRQEILAAPESGEEVNVFTLNSKCQDIQLELKKKLASSPVNAQKIGEILGEVESLRQGLLEGAEGGGSLDHFALNSKCQEIIQKLN